MARLLDFYAKMKWSPAAKELSRTADPDLYAKRLEKTPESRKIVRKFHDALLDSSEDLVFRGNAVPLKKLAAEGRLNPDNSSISISISGGSLRVFAFLSFLETLRNHGIPITNYAGTSAGSLASFIDRAGFDFKSVWKVMDAELVGALMFDINWWNLIRLRSPLEGDRIIKFVETSLGQRYKSKTMEELPGLFVTSVLVNSYRNPKMCDGKYTGDISSYERVIFSYLDDPQMKVAEALFSSMCLPVFKSLRFREREFTALINTGLKKAARKAALEEPAFATVLSTRNGRTIDGGYMNNFPFDILLMRSGPADVVINLVADYPGQVEVPEKTIFSPLISTPVDIHFKEELDMDRIIYRDANVIHWEIGKDVRNIGLTDFHRIPDLIEAGRKSATALLSKLGIIS